MPKYVTQFDLLISCPSDVRTELDIIKETVANFNRMYGTANNASINTKHWSTDSYPESGGHPQQLLNKQFVFDCDAAVAVFWTRFGTPTEQYDSGTEEEIEELIKSGKQVFLYFSDCPVNPSLIDHEQYQRVLAFRNKYKDNGIYSSYSNIEEFRKDFLNHLSLYFVRLLTGAQSVSANSKLSIKGTEKGRPVDQPKTFKNNYINSSFIVGLKNTILENFEEIKRIHFPKKEILPVEIPYPEEQDTPENSFLSAETKLKLNGISLAFKDQMKGFNSIFSSSTVEISDEFKQVISGYSTMNDINLDDEDEFFSIGDLLKQQQPMGGGPYGMGPSHSLLGTDDEKRKYQLIKDLYWKILEYRQFEQFLTAIDSKYFLDLVVSNLGSSFDEDVDIRIYIEKGILCNIDDLPSPESGILEQVNAIFEVIYKPKKSVVITEFDNYPMYPPNISVPLGLGGYSYEEELENNKREYLQNIKTTFCYEFFQDEEYDIICYNQKYIKQNTNIFFPSKLVFNSIPTLIKYEISSKYCAELIKGDLEITGI